MKIAVKPQDEELIRQRVDSGSYGDAADVVHAALIALDEQERLGHLRAELSVGLKQLERGEGVPLTRERYEMIKQRAIEGWKSGKTAKDAVKP